MATLSSKTAATFVLIEILFGIYSSHHVIAHEQTVISDRPGQAVPSPEGDHLFDTGPVSHRDHLTGNWGGVRNWLWQYGINPELVYTLEFNSNIDGGENSATSLFSNLDLSVTVSTEKLGWWDDGVLFLFATKLSGQGVSSDIGSLQEVSNIEADDLVRLVEYNYQHHFFDKRLRIKIGKQDANVDFSASEISGEFLNGGISPAPNVPLPTYPDTAFGITAFFSVADWLSIAGGVYNGELDGSINDTGRMFEGEVFSILQFESSYPLFNNHDGTYRVGAWLHSVDTEQIATDSEPDVFRDNYGLYLLFDQMVFYRERKGKEPIGIDSFLQISWAPSDRNEIDFWAGGGLRYSGFNPNIHGDSLGLAITYAHLSNRLENRFSETVIEVFYKTSLTNWLTLQPDIQYIWNPGGNGNDALACLIRAQIAF